MDDLDGGDLRDAVDQLYAAETTASDGGGFFIELMLAALGSRAL